MAVLNSRTTCKQFAAGRRIGKSRKHPWQQRLRGNIGPSMRNHPASVQPRQASKSIDLPLPSSPTTCDGNRSKPNCTIKFTSGLCNGDRGIAENFANRILDHFRQQRVGLRLLDDGEPRIKLCFDGVRSQQRTAKGVNRADPGGVEISQQRQPAIDLCRRRRFPIAGSICRGCGRAFPGPRDR